MEPNDIVFWIIIILSAIAAGFVLLVVFGLLRSAWQHSRTMPPPVRVTARAAPRAAPAAGLRQPPPLPELVAEAAETPPDKRLIEATADTLRTVPEEVRSAVWAAVVPRMFNADILAALRPEWRSRAAGLYDAVQRLWFVDLTPGGSCVRPVVRRAMLRHLYRREEQLEVYLQDAARAAKYFHAKMMRSTGSDEPSLQFVSDTFYRFLPPDRDEPAATTEWLYHLAVVDPPNAAQALQQLGDAWLLADRRMDLQNLLAALREHADENRLTDTLYALVYFYLGQAARRANKLREALVALEQARRRTRSDLLLRDRVIGALSEALDVINAPGDRPPPDGAVWSSLARPPDDRAQRTLWTDLQLPQPRGDALRRIQERWHIYRAAGNRAGEAIALREIGDEHRRHANYRVALEWYRRALQIWKDIARQRPRGEHRQQILDEALTVKAMGDIQYLMGHSDEALISYDQAVERLAQLKDKAYLAEADVHKARGDVLHFLQRYTEALPEYQWASSAYHRAGAVISEAETTLALGRLRQAWGDVDEAQHCFDEALDLYRERGSSIGAANALLVIGTGLVAQGQLKTAAQRLNEAMLIYQAEKNEPGEAAASKALGDVLLKLKEPDQALERYEEALTQFRAAGLLRNTAETQLAVGRLYVQRQDFDTAHDRYQLALIQFHDIEDQVGEADVRLALGELWHLQQRSREAVKLYEEALALYRATRYRRGEALAIRYLGDECLLLRDDAGALTNFQAALNLWKELGVSGEELEETYGRLGHALALLDRRDEAQQAYETAAALRSPAQFSWLGWRSFVAGRFAEAAVHFSAALNREQIVMWQIGQGLSFLGTAQAEQAETVLAAALPRANFAERAETCRWIEYAGRMAPDVRERAEQIVVCETESPASTTAAAEAD